MSHIGLLIELRTFITALALVFSLMILGDTRKIYRTPWAFWFIAIRMFLSLTLRCAIWLQLNVGPHVDGGLKTLFSFLDLFTIISMWLGYGTVFDETPFRTFIRKYWPFK